MSKHTKATATLLALAAVAAPSASARPVDQLLPNASDSHSGDPAVVVSSSSRGFDWGDAGIGAAAMLSLLGAGSGVVLVTRRSRGQQAIG
jgi:hypothetical protein